MRSYQHRLANESQGIALRLGSEVLNPSRDKSMTCLPFYDYRQLGRVAAQAGSESTLQLFPARLAEDHALYVYSA